MLECEYCGKVCEGLQGLGKHISTTHESDEKWKSEKWLRKQHHEEERSLSDIADEVGKSSQAIANVMEMFGIDRRGRIEASRLKKREEKVTYYTSNKGYEVWKDKSAGNKSFSVHRLAAIAEYGKEAVSGNHVHHKNGIPWDNRIENLEVMTNSEHQKRHYENGDSGITPGFHGNGET